jgi:phenylacetate-CoA ligase
MPVRLQEAALSAYARYLESIYYGRGYEEYKQWLLTWKTWSPTAISRWRNERLHYIVETAARHVPFYRDSLRAYEWKAVQSENDLHRLPILEKQSLRQRESTFVKETVDRHSLWVQKTSGTTGTSLKIYWPKVMVPKWWAIMEVMVRYVAGVKQEMPRAMVGGRPVIPGDTQEPPFWRFNRRWNQLYCSSYHISLNSSLHYIRALKQCGSQWMTGYGSAIAALAENAAKEGIEPPQLRSVITSGDTLLSSMRASIEQYFNCKCFDHYGQSEGVAMAMECTYGRLHTIPMLGVIEILREDGTPCISGEVGEIVATSLLNDAMPLIRYRIGDYAAWAEDQSCPCGNANAIITHLEGRIDDYLITIDGRKVGRLSTAMKRCPTIHSAQIVQDCPGHAYLLIRPGEGYESAHATSICNIFRGLENLVSM